MSLASASLTVLVVGALSLPVASAATATTVPVNLAATSAIQISTSGPPDTQFSSMESSYSAALTSGEAWRGFCRQVGRDITITLPQMTAVKSVTIQFEQNDTSGIYYPNHVDFEAASGGQWYQVASEDSVIPETDKRITTQTFSVRLNNLQTNQLRIHVPVGVWVFARRLAVNGTPVPGAAPSLPTGSTAIASSFTQPMHAYDSRSRGIKNMLLVYTGANGDLGTWSSADFAPMVAYQDTAAQTSGQISGQTSGPMFDTMLFLPYGSMQDNQQSWQSYITDLFTAGRELDALNTAVGNQNQLEGTYGSREKVVLTIPYPQFGDGMWGSVGGQAVMFNATPTDPAALDARNLAIQWYVQTLMQDWNAAGFSNLDFVGLYWDKEYVSYGSPGETAMIQQTSNLVHQNGKGFFWIPFYDASGISQWQTLGFDAAWLQPNYAEQGSAANIERVQNADAYAKQLGLGIELELTGGVQYTPVQSLYYQTVGQLEMDGMADGVSHAYYAGSKDFVKSYNSLDPATHQVYDTTHDFMQHN